MNKLKAKIWHLPFLGLIMLLSLIIVSCSDDSKESPIVETDANIEKIDTLIQGLTELQKTAHYGTKKGMYPPESKEILTNAISGGNKMVLSIKYNDPKPTQGEIDQCLSDMNKAIADFKGTVLTEDIVEESPLADLFIDGMNGGYIDFGKNDDYFYFGTTDPKRKFTIECWTKITDVQGDMGSLLTTFYGGDGFNGWMINYRIEGFGGENPEYFLRMSYGMANGGIVEPRMPLSMNDGWAHIAIVYEDRGDGEFSWLYLNGEFKATAHKAAADYYKPNPEKAKMPMTAFAELNLEGTEQSRKLSGYMKHLRIWNSAKTEDEINKLMNREIVVTGEESDLLCAWPFDRKTKEGEVNIVDLTGKHTATLKNNFRWEETE